ncbi:cyclin-dependent kinase inhibitor 3 family protein [Desulfobacter curvatus]|uniref:cyclin-dependent kinase inhibitor 3 family protein n=1 Tax=Desulfobacter curvatus TaxID=2290 RepID=UPI00037BB946|nr:cyclin-dependent kinase inhibitor 3 family protein [Desulfobacter curvatus]
MVARTSHSHPLQIAEVQAGTDCGKIGITFCPGKHDRFAVTGIWARNLDIDLDIIKDWGASLVLTLLETTEMVELKVPALGEEIQHWGMTWVHLPIADYSVPDDEFEQNWIVYGKEIRHRLCQGENILIHCKGGLGRAGMIAARLLVELGTEPEKAIRMVRRVRSGAIETYAQLALVRRTAVINEEPYK